MARKITTKKVQTHFSCSCGFNSVDQITVQVKWNDLHKIGVVRRTDKTTGKPFLLQREVAQCNGESHYDDY